MKARCKGRVKEAAALVGYYVGDGSSPRPAPPRPATPQQLPTLTHTPPTRLYATPGWMLEASREIHPSTYIRC